MYSPVIKEIWMKLGIFAVLEQLPSNLKYKYAEIGVYAGDNAKNMLTIIPTEKVC
jgi:hypothetical protein